MGISGSQMLTAHCGGHTLILVTLLGLQVCTLTERWKGLVKSLGRHPLGLDEALLFLNT